MNRIEAAANKQSASELAITPISKDSGAHAPIACTPVAFAAFGAGYLVAMAFGPSDAVEQAVRSAVDDATDLTSAELINARRSAITA